MTAQLSRSKLFCVTLLFTRNRIVYLQSLLHFVLHLKTFAMNFRRRNQDVHQNLSYDNKSFQMVTLNRPPINPPVPSGNPSLPHSRNLGPPNSGNLVPPHSCNLDPPHSRNLVPPHSRNPGPPHCRNLGPPHCRNPGPPLSGNLVPPMPKRSNSNSSYVKMNSAAVNKETLYEKVERNEPLYAEVGRPQSFNEYSEPGRECSNADN